jgi:hypothetical protein
MTMWPISGSPHQQLGPFLVAGPLHNIMKALMQATTVSNAQKRSVFDVERDCVLACDITAADILQ